MLRQDRDTLERNHWHHSVLDQLSSTMPQDYQSQMTIASTETWEKPQQVWGKTDLTDHKMKRPALRMLGKERV